MKYLIALVLIICSSSAFSLSHCKKTLVLISGHSLSSSTSSMRKLFDAIKYKMNNKGICMMYMPDGYIRKELEASIIKAKNYILKQWPNYSKIVIIGHSRGGEAAYHIAEDLKVDLLVTLDPTSRDAFFKNKPKPRAAKKWINVYINGWRKFFSGCLWYIGDTDCWSLFGGSWGYEPNAYNIKFSGSHSWVDDMYEIVKDEVLRVLQ